MTTECPNPDHRPAVPAMRHGLCADCHAACVRQGTCEICYPDPHVLQSHHDLATLEAEWDNVYGPGFRS